MRAFDHAHVWTDGEIDRLERRMRRVYRQASDEMRKKLDTWLEDYEKNNKRWIAEVKAGTKTQAEYSEWLRNRLYDKVRQQDMIDALAMDAVNADVRARQLVHDEIPTILAENFNWTTYDIETQAGLDTMFTLYNQDSIRWMVSEEPNLLPTIDVPKDMRWSQQKITSAITQSILQGESIPNVVKRLVAVAGVSNKASERSARTAVTYAEAYGRQRAFERAESLGIPLTKTWHAHIDGRTRLAHREADGQTVGIHEKFVIGGELMECPSDPTASGELVYNCRCTQVGTVDEDGLPPAVIHRYSKLPKDVTYDDWKSGRYVTDRSGRETKASKRERGVA